MTRVRAERRGAQTVVTDLAGTEPWRPRVLRPCGRLARVALVQSRASLVAGDDVALEIAVEPGGALEIIELSATVAHHTRGGAAARLSVTARLGRDARLVWLGEPLIAAAGCEVLRATRVELEAGAAVLLREALVLGRAGEEAGYARAHTRITLEGRPVLDDVLESQPAWLLGSPVVAGGARMIEALTLAGVRDGDPPVSALQAFEPSTIWRSVGPARSGIGNEASDLARRWRRRVLVA